MRTPWTLLVTALCSVLCTPLNAQRVTATALNLQDSIVVRWAPTTVQAWERFNTYGCRIERVDVAAVPVPAPVRLSTDTLRPLSLERLKARFGTSHPYAPVVAQALYGSAMRPNSGDLQAMRDAANEATLRWSLCALYADIDPHIADALGYRWVDRSIAANGRYLYRVILLDPAGPDTALIAVDRRWGVVPITPGPAVHAEEGEGKIGIQWEREAVQGLFSAYWIERAQGTGPWQRLNKTPFVPMDNERAKAFLFNYTDTTIARDYLPYRYRVLGISAFGQVSLEAPVITAMGRDRTAPPSPEMKGVNDERGRLVVYWDQPAGAADLKGFHVEKTHQTGAAFVPLHAGLLPASTRHFTDTSRYLLSGNFYRVVAVDTAGNRSISMTGYGTLADSIAPAAPMGLTGSIDTSGVVTVRWPSGPEQDLLGYRVFFANAADHHFNNLSPEPMQDTVFRDTIPLRTLTKDIYYRVVAVDRSFNHSAMSTVLRLVKPDIVPPVAPVIERYQVNDSAVMIHFIPSSSPDVARHMLLRRKAGESEWREVIAWTVNDQRRTWTDRTVASATAYTYLMQAVDSAGNASARSVPLEVRLSGRNERPGVENVKALHLDEVVQVAWSAPKGPVKYYVIYRSKDGSTAASIGSAKGTSNTFADNKVPGKGNYRYAVKAVYADGGSSRIVDMSVPVEVR